MCAQRGGVSSVVVTGGGGERTRMAVKDFMTLDSGKRFVACIGGCRCIFNLAARTFGVFE